MFNWFFKRKKGLRVGDIMPLHAKGPFGAMIQVDPETHRIVAIFHN